MKRAGPILVVASAFLLAACGANATASTSPRAGTATNQFRNGASGQLVQINGQTLILSGANGDTTVSFTSATTISKTSMATLADIVPGTCIVAIGQKDATGTLIATTVRLAPMTSSGCPLARPAGPRTNPVASPRPRPTAQPSFNVVSGQVTAVSGTSITVLTPSGSQAITVPTTAGVTVNAAAAASDLQNGECIRAVGSKDSAGAMQATSIIITPPGPSGTCSGGFPGFGRSANAGSAVGASNG